MFTTINGTVALPVLQKDGYTFDGWSDGTKTYEGGKSYAFASTVVLTPLFTKVSGPSGSGTATVTVSWDGASLSCIVRVK